MLVVAVVAEAQQPIRIARIGYLGSTRSDPPEPFRQMLQRLGYIEGKNVQFEYRFIDGQQDKALRSLLILYNLTWMFLSSQLIIDPSCQTGYQDDPDCHVHDQ